MLVSGFEFATENLKTLQFKDKLQNNSVRSNTYPDVLYELNERFLDSANTLRREYIGGGHLLDPTGQTRTHYDRHGDPWVHGKQVQTKRF